MNQKDKLTEALVESMLNEQVPKKKEGLKQITLITRDNDKNLEHLLEYIKTLSTSGHSFIVSVDPDDKEYNKTFGIDGDGYDQLLDIKTQILHDDIKTENYNKGQKYSVKYIDTNGKEKCVEIQPEHDMNVPQMIMKLKDENKDFLKLI